MSKQKEQLKGLLVAKDGEEGARGSETVKVQLRSTLVSDGTDFLLDWLEDFSHSLVFSDLNAIVTVCLHVSTGGLLWSVCYQRWVLWFLRLRKMRETIFKATCDEFCVCFCPAGKENVLVKQAHSLDSDHVSLTHFYPSKYSHSSN